MIARYPLTLAPPPGRGITQLYQSAAKIGIYEPPSRVALLALAREASANTFSALEPRECLQLVDAHDWRPNQ